MEGVFIRPEGKGTFPGVVVVHGHGGFGLWGWALRMGFHLHRIGFAVFLPSQTGHGFSEGDPDLAGPRTIDGIVDGVKIFLQEEYVDKNKLGIWGVSSGATVSSLLLVKHPDLFKTGVLEAGVYDLKKDFERPDILPEIKEQIIKECGATKEALIERSSLSIMENLSAPVLVLHGNQDDRASVEQAILLDKRLNELGKEHKTVILKSSGHHITKETISKYTFPFLKIYLK